MVCPGDGDIQLMYNGGVMLEGGQAMWYDDAGLTNNIGSGNPLIIPAPIAPTTYFVRFEGDCDTSSSVSTTVNMNIGSSAPTSVSSNRNNICSEDGIIVLSYTGGVLGTGATARWYTDTTNAVVLGAGNNLNQLAPSVSTEYFVRFEGECDSTAFVGTSVNILPFSVAPDQALVDRDTVCPGDGNITLSFTGGDPGSNGIAVWYDNSTLTNQVGTGNNLVIPAPIASTEYFVRYEADCDMSSTVSVLVTIASIPEPAFAIAAVNACVNGPLYTYSVVGQTGSLFNWSITNGSIVNNFNDSILVDWGDQIITGVLEVVEINAQGCVSPPVTLEVNVGKPTIEFTGDLIVCMGEVGTIETEDDYITYLWQDGSTASTFTTAQEGWVVLGVTDSIGCAASDSVYITLVELPVVDLGPDTSLCGDEGFVLNAGSDGIFYNWSTGENTQEITLYQSDRQEIWVSVENEYGCISGDTIVLDECWPEIYFRDIPTAITPNGDGVNDVWNLVKLASFSQAEVLIYDRWGTLVWKSEPGYSIPWDGRKMNGDEVPMDSYHFVIKLNVGSRDSFTGIVTVIK
jgi:gliding motility-associated-like protein